MRDERDWGPWRGGVAWSSADPHEWGVYDNNLFVVISVPMWTAWGRVVHLAIRRKDMQSATWDEKQRIKTDLMGAAVRAIEVFPAESSVVNQAPVSHLWVLPESFTLPFGLREIAGPV